MFQIWMVAVMVVLLGGCAVEQGAVGGYRMVIHDGGGVVKRKPDCAPLPLPPSSGKVDLVPGVVEYEVWYYPPQPRYGYYNPYPPSYSGLTYQSYPLFSFGSGGHRHHYHQPKYYCSPPPCPRPHSPKPCPPKKR